MNCENHAGVVVEGMMERETRIELATNSLEGCDSTIELLPLLLAKPGYVVNIAQDDQRRGACGKPRLLTVSGFSSELHGWEHRRSFGAHCIQRIRIQAQRPQNGWRYLRGLHFRCNSLGVERWIDE